MRAPCIQHFRELSGVRDVTIADSVLELASAWLATSLAVYAIVFHGSILLFVQADVVLHSEFLWGVQCSQVGVRCA